MSTGLLICAGGTPLWLKKMVVVNPGFARGNINMDSWEKFIY